MRDVTSFVLFASIGAGRVATYVAFTLLGLAMLRWNRALTCFVLETNTEMLDGIRGRSRSSRPDGWSTSRPIVLVVRAIVAFFGACFTIGCIADLILGVH
jgi:hypothetical protein